jgi:hypothetical protein
MEYILRRSGGGERKSLMLNGEVFSIARQHGIVMSSILWYSEASCVKFLEGKQAKTDMVGSLSCFWKYELIV